MPHRERLAKSLILLVAALPLGCEMPAAAEALEEQREGPRPQGIYIPVELGSVPMRFRAFAEGDPSLSIYLHRHGGTYYGGNDNSAQNISSVVGQGSATLSAFAGGDNVRNQVVSCVQDQFARFNAVVTDVEPTSGDYIEAVIGGTPGQVGLPQGVGGVAPYDPYGCNVISRAVVYVFSGALPNNAQLLCEIAGRRSRTPFPSTTSCSAKTR